MIDPKKRPDGLGNFFLRLVEIIIKSFDDLGTIVRYGISGIVSILVNLLVIYFLTDILGLWYLSSATIAFIVSFVIAFTLLRYWTFRGIKHSPTHIQALTYLSVITGGLISNLILLYIFVDILGFWYLGVQIVALIFISGMNFIINKNVTFRERD